MPHRRTQPTTDSRPASKRRIALLTLLITFSLSRLLFARPLNLFGLLDLPLNVSPSTLQANVANRMQLDETMHRLLTKLGSVEGRTAYIRLGAAPLLDCTFCRSYTERASAMKTWV